jgi:GH15 family glucan-1,4-alpha-glucosidase
MSLEVVVIGVSAVDRAKRFYESLAAHALLSDCHSAALVAADGSVDGLCFPRFDSPSVFGRLLDDAAGHWSIRPAGAYTAGRRYRERTLVLETSFRTPGGTVVVPDALATGAGTRGHDLGKGLRTC